MISKVYMILCYFAFYGCGIYWWKIMNSSYQDIIFEGDDSIYYDVSERAKLYSTAFSTSPVAYAIASPETGFHFDVNAAWSRLLGYTRKEALEQDAVSLGIWYDPEERKQFVSLLEKNGAVQAFESQFQRKDGEIIDVMIWGEYVNFNGQPRLFNVYNNITERKNAERRLARKNTLIALLKSVASIANETTTLNDALVKTLHEVCSYTTWGAGKVYLLPANRFKAEERNLWYISEDAAFSNLNILRNLYSKHYEEITHLPIDVVEKGVMTWNFTSNCGSADCLADNYRDLGLYGQVFAPIIVQEKVVAVMEFFAREPIRANDDLISMLKETAGQIGRVIERANTEAELLDHRNHLEELVKQRTIEVQEKARQLEIALEKEKELNIMQRQFVAMASHEFRTPLTIIDNAAQLLKRSAGNLKEDIVHKRCDRVRQAVDRMNQLMESTLIATKIEDGGIDIKVSECNLGDLLHDVCQQVQEISSNHALHLRCHNLPETVMVDKQAMTQVIPIYFPMLLNMLLKTLI